LRHIERHTAAARGRGRSRSRPRSGVRAAGEPAAHRYPLRGSQREGSRSDGSQTRQAADLGAGSGEEADDGLPPSGTVVYSIGDTGERTTGSGRGSAHPKRRPEYPSLELLSVSRASDRTHKYTARFRVDGQDKAIHFGAVGASPTRLADSEAVALPRSEYHGWAWVSKAAPQPYYL
jgi:hypothetical protein